MTVAPPQQLPAFADAKAFRAWRSDPPQWLPIALDIARGHGIDTGSPHVFSTGTNLVVGLGETLILKIFPPLLRAQFVSERGSLMQLSGRQTKRERPITTSGMLAGLWVLQGALGPLARHGPEGLNAMLEDNLPLFATNR